MTYKMRGDGGENNAGNNIKFLLVTNMPRFAPQNTLFCKRLSHAYASKAH